jgi:hypothetical protein
MVCTSPLAHAALITNGDFSAPLFGSGEFMIGSNFDKWFTWGSQYTLASGPTGDFARHVSYGGSDHKLVQFIDAGSLASGSVLQLNFDYIYDQSVNAANNPKAVVSLIGISANRTYSMYGGAGTDGNWATSGDYTVGASDVLLSQAFLDYSDKWITDYLLSATLSGSYFALGIIVQSGCDNTAVDCDNFRGVDNFGLISVPEPSTLALFGLGLIGLGLARRRKLN